MEKIVTKIGDVTIERRVSKTKTPLETSYDNNVQRPSHPLSKISSGLTKAEEIARLTELKQSSFKSERSILNHPVTKPTSTILLGKSFNFGSDLDISTSTPKKQTSINSHDFPGSYLKTESAQNSDGDLQYMTDEKMDDEDKSGESLPKVPRVDVMQKQFTSAPVRSHKYEPDLSKLVGISIERRKSSNMESQSGKTSIEEELSQLPNFNSGLSIKRINLKESLDSCSDADVKSKEVLSEEEDSFDEEDLDDDSVGFKIKEEPGENIPSDSSQAELGYDEEPDKSESDEIAVVEDDPEEVTNEVEDEEESPAKEDGEEQVLKEEPTEEETDTKKSNINEFACNDLMELMKKGKFEGEIEDVKDEEMNESSDNKKVGKRKSSDADDDNDGNDDDDGDGDGDGDDEDDDVDEDGAGDEKKEGEEEGVQGGEGEKKGKGRKRAKKKRKLADKKEDGKEKTEEEGDDESKNKNIDKSKVTNASLRKNIREVMDETKLDEATLAAQRQEAERLKRLQEQQRIIREVQRQIALNRQNQKSQNKVLSLLQGNSQTSILKTSSSAATQVQSSQSKAQNSVLVKLSNGEQTSLNNKKMLELLKNSKNKTILGKPQIPRTLFKQGMVTPSVSIAPVKKETPVDDKKKKKGDVVTLSSDSDDDCIVLSEEDESEPEEDPTNSGMHTNDKYNLPDEKGQVIVNVGHPESESDLYLAPQIARVIKPHQIGGIRFLYDNIIESTERFSSSTGFGCILAHSMGLGKTLQVVSFSDIFLRYTPAKTILCIIPINTIQNWLAEFNFWLPKENSSSSSSSSSATAEEVRFREFELYIVNETLKNIHSRAKVILDWQKTGGVLLMGYELFRLLSQKKYYKSKKKKKEVEEDDGKNKELIEEIYSALVVPGPDLVICDEGHRIKNSHATTSQALKQIRTKRRIVLTGYPLQNNLLEYWCMVDFVRPNYLGTKTEFSNMFERPIQNGQCIDSTPQDKRLMRYRAHVLHSLLEGFVQRRSHAVLQSALPEKEEYVLLLRFTSFQRKLYDTFMNEVVRTVAVPNPLKAFAVCCKIWNHPDVLYNFLKKKGEGIDLDLEEVLPPSLHIPQYPYAGQDGGNQQGPGGVPGWPKRGPGSRGGKIRQAASRKNGRGRKPAATISPNVTSGQEKGSDTFGSGQYPASENFSNQPETVESFQRRNYNQSQFDFGGEFENPSNAGYGNASYHKNPLNNLEELSSNDFQSKRFFSAQPDTGNRIHYGNPAQNFDTSGRPEGNYNNSNETNLTAGFDSNLNAGESAKSFDFNQEFNSEFYSSSNYQSGRPNQNYSRENKSSVFQANPAFFQNQNFPNADNFDYQSSSGGGLGQNFQGYPDRSNSNFQNSTSGQAGFQRSASGQQRIGGGAPVGGGGGASGGVSSATFQNSSLGSGSYQDSNSSSNSNFPSSFQTSAETSFDGNRFGQNSNSNFQGSGTGGNFDVQNRSKTFSVTNAEANFPAGNYEHGFWPQSNWAGYTDSTKSDTDSGFRTGNTGTADFVAAHQQKFNSFDGGLEPKGEAKEFASGNGDDDNSGGMYSKMNCEYSPGFDKNETDSKMAATEFDEAANARGIKSKEEDEKKEDAKSAEMSGKKDESLSYDWATDLFKSYVTGIVENSSKMEVFFHIVTESIRLSDRLLVFSQSLLTLDLIEDYLQRRCVPGSDEFWTKSRNYFRLDGSTPGLEREKLINEFNSNQSIHIFLVSTRAGSLGINLVGANRVVVFDASWNPCHDTQAVCRVYRYGQRKPCFVYRLVMDSCLEKKIYDRQVNKQGMADRVVDELNPDAHLSIKEVTNLCWDDQEETTVKDFSDLKEKYNDEIIKILLERCSKLLSKEPFQHESLLIDRKEKKLSQAEKRLAKRSYELEKQAANQPKSIYSFFPNAGQRNFVKPIASVRPMQSEMNTRMSPQLQNRSKWIPADVWQKQGMSAQEMTLPLDVVIPTSSPEKASIVLKAGQKVMVLKSPKGIYMQLENGKIIAIRSAFKVGQNERNAAKHEEIKSDVSSGPAVKSTGNVTISPKSSQTIRTGVLRQPFKQPFAKFPEKKMAVNANVGRGRQVMGKAKPFLLNRKFESVTPDVKQRLMGGKVNVVVGQDDDKQQKTEDEKPIEKTVSKTGGSFSDEKATDSSDEKKTEDEKPDDKCEMADSLETLRKVTEKISDSAVKRDEADPEAQNRQANSLKTYRHDSTSQAKGNAIGNAIEEKVGDGDGSETKEASQKEEGSGVAAATAAAAQQQQQQGTENVQNWLMNQSYPPVDPYGNYFPGYYAYGPGPGPMMPPYDGFYPPGNYPHPMGRNGASMVQPPKQPDNPKGNPQAPVLTPALANENSSAGAKNPAVVNAPPVYPPYPNPYTYPYNYPNNPGFNGQGFPFPNQSSQPSQQAATNTGGSGRSPNASAAATATASGQSQPVPYDNSMYSAFHRPEAPFQAPENPYPSPYPRPPYPSSGTPGFFPYNPPYANYPYGHNFNPYMHPSGYGYPMQNHGGGGSQRSDSHAENPGGGAGGGGGNSAASSSS